MSHPALAVRPPQPVVGTGVAETQQALRLLDERRQTIEEIRAINTGARPDFLAKFSTEDLRDYLEHLRHARHKAVRLPGWAQRRTEALAEARRTLRKAG